MYMHMHMQPAPEIGVNSAIPSIICDAAPTREPSENSPIVAIGDVRSARHSICGCST